MVQNVDIIANKITPLNCADIIEYYDRVFILTRDTSCLFEYSRKLKKMKLCGVIGDGVGQTFLSMSLCDNKIYIAPYEADGIYVYDVEEEIFEKISLTKIFTKLKKKYFYICFSYDKKIYFLGGTGTTMLCVDTYDNTVQEEAEWIYEFKKRYGFETRIRTRKGVCIVDNCLWIAIEGDNLLLQYNLVTRKYHFWEVGNKKMQYVTVNFDGEYFWLSGYERLIVRWKKETNELKEFDNFPDSFECNNENIPWKELFCNSHIYNNNIYFVPLNSNMLIEFNRETQQMKCVMKSKKDCICLGMMEIGNNEIYVEEDDYKSLHAKEGFIFKADGEYQKYLFSCSENDDINLENINKYIKLSAYKIIENHPKCVGLLLNMIGDRRMCLKESQSTIWEYVKESDIC